jgi:hypothetical protein
MSERLTLVPSRDPNGLSRQLRDEGKCGVDVGPRADCGKARNLPINGLQLPPKQKAQPEGLKGWAQIAQFLGQPIAVAQRWARSGMPVKREGRFVTASPEELSRYLGREAGLDVPVHIASEGMDLSADLKRALSYARAGAKKKKQPSK